MAATDVELPEGLQIICKNLEIIYHNIEQGIADAKNELDEETMEVDEAEPEEEPKKLSKYTKKIQKISETIDKFRTYSEYISKTIEELKNPMNYISPKWIQYIKNKINIISLKIKQAVLWIQLKLTLIRRKLLLLASMGKIAPALQAIFGAIIIAIQAIFMAISAIIMIIEKILMLIPILFALTAEGIAFFLTPKSLKSTNMTIVNTNQSVERIIPTSVLTTINEILDAPLHTMGINKKVAMAGSATASATAALNMKSENNIVVIPADISYKSRDYLLKSVNTILSLLPIAEPLPKYERLPMWKNLGYFIWLLTGWCPAGRQSFGLPGMP